MIREKGVSSWDSFSYENKSSWIKLNKQFVRTLQGHLMEALRNAQPQEEPHLGSFWVSLFLWVPSAFFGPGALAVSVFLSGRVRLPAVPEFAGHWAPSQGSWIKLLFLSFLLPSTPHPPPFQIHRESVLIGSAWVKYWPLVQWTAAERQSQGTTSHKMEMMVEQ